MADKPDDPWEISKGIEDPHRFFRILAAILPEATHVFVEGASIAEVVAACYERFADPGPYLPPRHTIWPRSALHRCGASVELFDELAALAEVHAEPELLDHLAVYQDETMLLAWPDAFANVARLNGSLPASTVARLAAEFGCEYARVPSRSP